MHTESRPGPSALFVVVLILAALIPIAWLVGRRTAPEAERAPILLRAGSTTVDLQENPGGIAGTGTSLPPAEESQRAYRLRFLIEGTKRRANPPYRLRLDGPDGRTLWKEVWTDSAGIHEPVEIVMPRVGLASGRHSLRIEDAGGTVRSYPFIVP